MSHIKGFGLNNFRVFKTYHDFEFAPITVFTGPNNSGKSSVIKALNLVRENNKSEGLFEKLTFSKESNLGKFESVLSDPKNQEIVFDFKIKWDTKFLDHADWHLELKVTKNKKTKEENGSISEVNFYEAQTGTSFLKIQFLNKKIYVLSDFEVQEEKAIILSPNIQLMFEKLSNLVSSGVGVETRINFVDNVQMTVSTGGKESGIPIDIFSGIYVPKFLRDVEQLTFPEMVKNEKFRLNLRLTDPSVQLFESRYINYSPAKSLIFNYSFSEDLIPGDYQNLLIAIETEAVRNVSKGKCSFEKNKEFLHSLKNNDFFHLFSINNARELSIFRAVSSYMDINRIEEAFYFFELLFYEVNHLLNQHNIHENISLNIQRYREIEREMTEADNSSSYRYEENRGLMVPNNIMEIENFFANFFQN